MLPLLTVVLIMESCLALLLVSRLKPLVKMACLIVDVTKTTRGSAVSKTLAVTLFILLASSISTFVKARQHMLDHHGSEIHGSPAEFFMMRTAELESALSGFILLLALMINRVHFFLREAQGLKKQSRNAQSEYLRLQQEQRTEGATLSELQELKNMVEEMRGKVEKMQVDVQIKEKEVRAAEASVLAIRKQTEGISLEYERLIDDNENLRSQLAALDRSRDRLEAKKHT